MFPWSKKERKAEAAMASGSGKVDWKYGLFDPVHDDGEESIVDIYFIHGLNGDRLDTFTFTQQDGTRCFWPKDLLPIALHAANPSIKCRIYSYGYNASTHTGKISLQSLLDHGAELLRTIAEEREIEGKSERPIIFMAHSLGGLVVKSALNFSYLSSAQDDPVARQVFLSTHAIFFFGVPHQGGNASAVSVGGIVLNIIGTARNTTTKMIDILDPGNQALEANFAAYNKISHHFNQRSYWEKYKTPVKLRNMEVKNVEVVPKDSATIPGMKNDSVVALSKDHHGLVRFESANDPDFKTVVRALILELRKSSKPINDRWAEWRKELRQKETPSFRIRANLPFPPNPRFKGRKSEIVQLQHHLNTIDEAQYAVICGTGGIGKTTLALQYCLVNEHAHSLIIWVNARTTKTAEESYIWLLKEIIRSKAEDAPQRRPDFSAIAQDLGIQGMLKQDGSLDVEDNLVQRQKAVEGVRSWLEQQVNRSWLIVFDEVDDVQVPIKDFIPRCKWGSYIVTTRRPEVRNYANYGFDLGGLSIGESIELLLHGTAFDSTDPQVTQKAEEIVKMLDRHPLGIDQASAYIRNRPFITLEDYIEKFKNKLEETRPRELMIRNENLWPDYSLTCMTTFEISRDAIENEMSDAMKVLQLCCWLDRDDIWIPFLKAHKQSVSMNLRDEDMDGCVALLYSYSLVQPKLAAHAFSIHSLVHFWGRERLEIKERMATMLMAFYSLVHSPYQSSGDGEIYKVSSEDFKLQRSAVQHLEYALEVGDEAIGYWNLRYSADSLGLSDRRMRNYIFDVVDEVFGGLGSFPDYPKPRTELIRFSSVRPLRTEVAKSEMVSSFQGSMDTLKNIWTMISSIPAILWEQGKLRLSLRWQLRTLSYIFTYSPTAFNAIMTPDRFNQQVPISILASTLVLQNLGETRAAERLVVFLRETYAIRYPMSQSLQLQAKMTHDRVNRQLGRVPTSQDEELDMESIMAALSFTRAKKHEDDQPEQMNLVFESAETFANSLLRKEDFACVDIFRKIKTKRAEELPNGEVDYSLCCYNLGNALRLKGAIQGNKDSLREARDLFQEALTRLTVLLGESDYRKVRCIFALGSTHIYLGDFVLAEQHLSQTMIAYKDVPDATVYDKIGCLEKLSDARVGMKKYAMAAEGFFRCWKQRVLRLGVDHAGSLQAMISWARCLYHLGREGSASLLFVGALERKRAQSQFDRRTQEAVAYLLRVVRERDSGSEGRKGDAIRERYILDFAQSVNAKGLPAGLRAPHRGN